MPKKKRRRGLFDLFGFDEPDIQFEPKSFSEGNSGYSISVTYEKGKPIVKVQTQGDIDVAELRRDIERKYPGAKIEGLEKQPLIRVVDEEPKVSKEDGQKEVKKDRKKKKQPLIRVVE